MKNKHSGFLTTFFAMCIKFTRSKKVIADFIL